MRWIIAALLLLVAGSLFGLGLNWPGDQGGPARSGVTLAEFQRGIRIDRPFVAAAQITPQTSRPEDGEAVAPGPEPAGHANPAAVSAALPPEPPSAPPEARARPDLPPAGERLAEAIPPAGPQLPSAQPGAAPPQERPPALAALMRMIGIAEDSVAETTPEPGPATAEAAADIAAPVPATPSKPPPPATRVRSGAGAGQPGQGTPSIDAAVRPVAMVPPLGMEESQSGPGNRPLATGRAGFRISVYYHPDERSRIAAQRLVARLASAGFGAAQMHTAVHAASAPRVRYFAADDAPAAAALAQVLSTARTVWRVEDCTLCRHKAEAGVLQVWSTQAE